MSHSHHGHHDHSANKGGWKLAAAIAVNLFLTIAQIVGGILSGSLALIADAIHNLSDALSLVIAFGARRIARRPADAVMTFGYGRAEIVAALVNYTTLILIGLYLASEAVMRFFDPQPVEGWTVVWLAGLALAVDLVTAALTYSMAKESMNIRAAFLHNVADALGSVAVIAAGTLILLYGWNIVDPLVTLMIAGYILWQSFREIRPVIRILMLGSPPDIDTGRVIGSMQGMQGVAGIHHVHFWMMQEQEPALDAHVVVDQDSWGEAPSVKERLKAMLAEDFGIAHATLELESSAHACRSVQNIGH